MVFRFSVMWLLLTLALLALDQPISSQRVSEDDLPVTVHVVQRGENLYRIALHYDVTTDAIAAVNGIANPSSIQVGQRLIIPIGGYEPPAAEPVIHIVRIGENLTHIADLYETTVEAIVELNGLTGSNLLFVGQAISIPDSVQNTAAVPSAEVEHTVLEITLPPEAEASGVRHVVRRGETLFSIARQYGVTMGAIESANSLANASLIFAGQELVIPGADRPNRVQFASPISSVDILPLTLVEGQSGRVRVVTTSNSSVTGRFLERDMMFVAGEGGTQHIALIAVPIYTAPGVYPMTLAVTAANGQAATLALNIQIRAGNYGSQNINLPQDRLPLLAPAVEDNELNLLRGVTSGFTSERHFHGIMSLPAAAVMNSPFGTRRSYNGGAVDRFHAGADFAGAPGSSVLAAAPGRVVLADTLHIRGISVVIDHGWGVYTNYSHLAERYVHVGDFVGTGQVLGTVGNTGRATGAHLHWELWLNGVPVDPMQWVRQNFFGP